LQKQNDFLTRELRKTIGSPPPSPSLPRASTPPPSSRTNSKFLRHFRFDFDWKMAHRHCSELAVTCVVYASDGQFLREITSENSAEFPAVQLSVPAQTQGDTGKLRMDIAFDKIGNCDLVFFVAKKTDGSSFYDVLNFTCSLIGYDILLLAFSFAFSLVTLHLIPLLVFFPLQPSIFFLCCFYEFCDKLKKKKFGIFI
jgi:hypothetical protein